MWQRSLALTLGSCPSRARSHRAHGESPALTDRSSLTAHGNTSLLTPRGSPDLCKAVLDLLREPAPNQEMPSPGGQISRMTSPRTAATGQVGRDVASPRSPGGLPHASPGAEPDDAHTSSVEGCPRAAAWSGCARSTGCHPASTRFKIDYRPSSGRPTLRRIEKPGEVAKTFLVVNSAASVPWCRWRCVGRTSWL